MLTLHNFVLAMLTYPEAQIIAHKELDQVLGQARLPTFEDRAALPYTTAILQEVLRCRIVSRALIG